MTITAAATSVPDTFVGVRASVMGRSQSSASNVLGSNVFDLLVAVPLAVMVTRTIAVNFTQIVPMMMFLVVATIVMLVFMFQDLEMSIRESHVMMILYMGFGVWMTLEAFGVTSVLGVRAGVLGRDPWRCPPPRTVGALDGIAHASRSKARLPVRLRPVDDALYEKLDGFCSSDFLGLPFEVLALGAQSHIIPQDHVLDDVDQLHLDPNVHLALEHIHLTGLLARPKERSGHVVPYDPSLDQSVG